MSKKCDNCAAWDLDYEAKWKAVDEERGFINLCDSCANVHHLPVEALRECAGTPGLHVQCFYEVTIAGTSEKEYVTRGFDLFRRLLNDGLNRVAVGETDLILPVLLDKGMAFLPDGTEIVLRHNI